MGKKYDEYLKANAANEAAVMRLRATEGGSTGPAHLAAQHEAFQAEVELARAFEEFLADPEG